VHFPWSAAEPVTTLLVPHCVASFLFSPKIIKPVSIVLLMGYYTIEAKNNKKNIEKYLFPPKFLA